MPFIYFNNFLWTINFAKGQLKLIFYIFLTCFIVNAVATVLLIPTWGGEGAATAYLLSIILQSVLFLRRSGMAWSAAKILSLLLPPLFAAAAGVLMTYTFTPCWLILSSAVIIYLTALLFTKQIRRAHWHLLRQISGL
jgi:O-antigen/teichoic acid export membrane protein